MTGPQSGPQPLGSRIHCSYALSPSELIHLTNSAPFQDALNSELTCSLSFPSGPSLTPTAIHSKVGLFGPGPRAEAY